MKGISWEAPDIPPPSKILNIRKKRFEEAEDMLLTWLDDLERNEIKKATVIHGKSGGVLREMTKKTLKKDKRITDIKNHDEKGNVSLGAMSFIMDSK
ncbi:hypothetical protein CL645_03360 [bacterium]|nr:hypothetical protein [bacterium]MBD61880.1 hypothetical protein [bacterium]|tara:strand:- start:116 stop:406 length:291 start_codon:yes stop_codon:yes gene_type:complete